MGKHTTLAQFEFFVLIAIDRLGSGSHASEIRRTIEDSAGRAAALGAVYATLGRLEDKGLVEHRLDAPLPVRGGRGRKSFGLTSRGRAELERTQRAVQGMLSLPERSEGA